MRGRVPDNLGVPELGAVDGEDGISGVLGEGEAVVGGVGDLLGFFGCGVEGVDGDDAVGLVGEESGGVVGIDDGGTGEDALAFCTGVDGNGLIGPVVEILGGGMAPVLIAGDDSGWVIWYQGSGWRLEDIWFKSGKAFTLIVEMVGSFGVKEHAIGIYDHQSTPINLRRYPSIPFIKCCGGEK